MFEGTQEEMKVLSATHSEPGMRLLARQLDHPESSHLAGVLIA